MYKAIVRALVRKGINDLNSGDPTFLMKLAARDAQLAFPGDNSWATMHRPAIKSRQPHFTHRGTEELRSFADRFVSQKIKFSIEDILVNGPPWNTRVAIRANDYIESRNGDLYNNRVVAFMEIRWAKLRSWEDYEDTERVKQWDTHHATNSPTTEHQLTTEAAP